MNGTHIVARSPLYCIDSTGHNQNMLWENRQQKQKNIFVIISCLLDVVPTPSGNIVWFLSVRQYCLNFVGFSPTFDITHIECEHPFQFFYILFLPAASLRLFYVFLLAVYIVAITVFHINRAIKKNVRTWFFLRMARRSVHSMRVYEFPNLCLSHSSTVPKQYEQ